MKLPPASVWRLRLIVAVFLAACVIGWFYLTDPAHGVDTELRLQFLAWCLVVVGPAYLVRRALLGDARSHTAWREAMAGNVAAALSWAALAIFTGLIYVAILVATMGSARAAELPPAAKQYLPILHAEQLAHWPDLVDPVVLGAQVEQETCPSLRSRSCWNPRAELKTCFEDGFGLGQITVAYTGCNGDTRFDNFAAARGLDASLRTWAWADRFDPARQLRVLVLMDRAGYRGVIGVRDPRERLAMAFSAYNGGLGGLRADQRMCARIKGCDPGRWFGNVERYSLKARAARAGYGQSAFAINRGYVLNVMVKRRARYEGWL